jgi:hypothetical protein
MKSNAAKNTRTKDEAKFTLRGTVKVSDSTSLTVSDVEKGGQLVGYTISKLINTPRYTGYTSGLLVPVANVRDFIMLFPNGNGHKTRKS